MTTIKSFLARASGATAVKAVKVVPFSQWGMDQDPKYKKYGAFVEGCKVLTVGKHKLQIFAGGEDARTTIGVLDGKVFVVDNSSNPRAANKKVAEDLQREANKLDGVVGDSKR